MTAQNASLRPSLEDHKVEPQDQKSLRMPGESGVWTIIFGDMLVFGMFFVTFAVYGQLNPDVFSAGAKSLNTDFGLYNTVILLMSSWFVVWGLRCAKAGDAQRAVHRLFAAMCFGAGFWILKLFEYSEQFEAGYTLITDQFYSFYFMYTGIHLVHLTAGMGALLFAVYLARENRVSGSDYETMESIGAFWHLVDLLWIILFALLYLVY